MRSRLDPCRASGNGAKSCPRTLVAMRQPGATSRTVLAILWLVIGAAMVAVTVWLGWTRGRVILNGHPATVVLGLVTGLLGFVAAGLGGRHLRDRGPVRRPGRRPRPSGPAHPRPARTPRQGPDPAGRPGAGARAGRRGAARLLPAPRRRTGGGRGPAHRERRAARGPRHLVRAGAERRGRPRHRRPPDHRPGLPAGRPRGRRRRTRPSCAASRRPATWSSCSRNRSASRSSTATTRRRSSRTTPRSSTGRSAGTRSAGPWRRRTPTATGGWRACCCSPRTPRRGSSGPTSG